MTKPDINISPEAVATFAHKWGSKIGELASFVNALAADRDRLAKERDEAILLKDSALDSGAELLAKIQIAVRRMDSEHNFVHPGEIVYLAEKLVLERDEAAEQIHLLRGCVSADAQLLSAAIARAERAEAERDEARRLLGALP